MIMTKATLLKVSFIKHQPQEESEGSQTFAQKGRVSCLPSTIGQSTENQMLFSQSFMVLLKEI